LLCPVKSKEHLDDISTKIEKRAVYKIRCDNAIFNRGTDFASGSASRPEGRAYASERNN
jgi:hypothetical protein